MVPRPGRMRPQRSPAIACGLLAIDVTRLQGRLSAPTIRRVDGSATDHQRMAFDPLSGTHTVRVPARRNATRIVALRHASRVAARPTARSRVPRILGAVLVGVGLTTFIAVGLAVVMVTHDGRRAVGRAARPKPARGPDVLPADRRLRPDRDGRARPVPARGAAGRGVRRRPGAGPRRDDECRGPDVLVQQRVRRAGHPLGRGRRRQRRTRTRRLDDHPAARARPAAARPR